MIIGISILFLLAITAYLVLLPLILNSPDKSHREKARYGDTTPLAKNKEAVLTTINEIEFDYQMKKLSDDDYTQLKSEYKQKALEILREEDEEELETETVSLKRSKAYPENVNKASDKTSDQELEKETELENEIELELALLRKKRAELEKQ